MKAYALQTTLFKADGTKVTDIEYKLTKKEFRDEIFNLRLKETGATRVGDLEYRTEVLWHNDSVVLVKYINKLYNEDKLLKEFTMVVLNEKVEVEID